MNYGKNMISIYFVYNSRFCLGVQDGDEEQYAHNCEEEWKDSEESEDWELKTTTDIFYIWVYTKVLHYLLKKNSFHFKIVLSFPL